MRAPNMRPTGGPVPGGEDAVVARLSEALARASGPPPDAELWIGDDAAVVAPPSGPLVLAIDAACGGVHTDLERFGLDDLGWKAMAASLSDLAAMGARPLHALVSLVLAPGTDVDALNRGVAEASAHFACPVVGGDLSSGDQVVVAVAVTGTIEPGGPPAVRRSGARAGDHLVVTGPLGASAAGLRLAGSRPALPASPEAALVLAHRRPVARLAEGVTARQAGVRAMIDVSDGLSTDLDRLARASSVGVELDVVPVAPGATEAEALGGGEDYELVMATPDPRSLASAFAEAGLRPPMVIGRVTEDPTARRLAGRQWERTGFEHRLGP